MGNNKIDNDKNTGKLLAIFYHYADAVVWCGAHRLMKCILGFARSHWMLSLGKCLHCIATGATMVDNFVVKQKDTNKKLLLASQLMVNQSQNLWEFVPQNGYSTQLINATSFVWRCNTTIEEEELANISCYQMSCQRSKIHEVINLEQSSLKKWLHICTNRG